MELKSLFTLFFAKYVFLKNACWINSPVKTQNKLFYFLIKKAKNTSFGKDHSFSKISNYSDWKKHVPIRDYEAIKNYVDRVFEGKENILWPGKPLYLCKTSGSTSGIKYIPISKDSISHHIIAARDAILSYVLEKKRPGVLNGKTIFIQGSPKLSKTNGISIGRLSGIVAHHIPFFLKRSRLPSYKTNCISDWEKKIDAIIKETLPEKMSLIGGIPPWVQMYFEKLQAKTDKLIKDVFPSFELFVYGGVNYEPYRMTFDRLVGKKIDSLELYPASEGFIAYQDSQKEKGLLLCVNHGIFFEFIPANEFSSESPTRISLVDVKLDVNYVVILNTDAGLWGYNIGDTVKFVSLTPYRIVITGRIQNFTSAFGEHVIAEEVEKSLKFAIEKFYAEVSEFHVAPQVNPVEGLPYHEWLIEFKKEPKDLNAFRNYLDKLLQNYNSYYKDLIIGSILKPLQITKIRPSGFKRYMKSIGKLGGQNKVPRLSNNRKIADKLINF